MPKSISWYTKIFNYFKPLWEGSDGKISLRNSLAITVSIHMLVMISRAVYKWQPGQSFADLALVLGIEAGLVAGILGLTTYSNIQHTKIDADAGLLEKPATDVPPENNRPTE